MDEETAVCTQSADIESFCSHPVLHLHPASCGSLLFHDHRTETRVPSLSYFWVAGVRDGSSNRRRKKKKIIESEG